jgi:protein-L-isoaspartate O-methyltransferase
MTHSATPDIFADWLAALEARHLADLRLQEVTRALRALSSAYVERRHKVAQGSTLDSHGKRVAFALFYAPLHFIATRHVVSALGAITPPPARILDIGCGTGAAGAAWAIAGGGTPSVVGVDRHPWAVEEARWTYRTLGVRGHARQGDATRVPHLQPGDAAVAAYLLNELPEPARQRLETSLLAASSQGVRVLILEPIARSVTPWWDAACERAVAVGGRADEWRIAVDLPPLVERLADAAGLNVRELKLKSLFMGG